VIVRRDGGAVILHGRRGRTNAIHRDAPSVQSPIKPIFDLFGVRRDWHLA
jgi:hypothetical protein